jgi:hypothetical protein
MAAEPTLDAAHRAFYHVLGAPGIASLTAACLTTDRAIDLGRVERLVKLDGEPGSGCCSRWQPSLYGREQGVSLSELLADLDGEDLDRVLYAIAVVKGRQLASSGSPDDLWIRAAEPDQYGEYDVGARSTPSSPSVSGRDRQGDSAASRCTSDVWTCSSTAAQLRSWPRSPRR